MTHDKADEMATITSKTVSINSLSVSTPTRLLNLGRNGIMQGGPSVTLQTANAFGGNGRTEASHSAHILLRKRKRTEARKEALQLCIHFLHFAERRRFRRFVIIIFNSIEAISYKQQEN